MKMTVRNPFDLEMQRNTPDWIEDCGNIVIVIGLDKEYNDPNHVLLDNSLPGSMKIVIQQVRAMRDDPVQLWNTTLPLLQKQKLEFSELLLANNLTDGLKLCDGKNPFAVIDFRHGDRYLGIGDVGCKEQRQTNRWQSLVRWAE